MHPRPDWFILLKYAVLKLIVCTGVATFTYSGYLIPILLGRIRDDFPYIPTIAVIMLSIIFLASLAVFAIWLFHLTMQFEFANAEDKICCGIAALANIGLAFFSIKEAVDSGSIGIGQFWDIVGQWYLWLLALLHGLLSIAMALYWLALVCLPDEAQPSGAAADGQQIVVVIQGEGASGGTAGTRATPGTRAALGTTAASSAT